MARDEFTSQQGPPVEPPTSYKWTRESTFKLLFRAGTATFLFGALFSQTVSPDRIPDLIIFCSAAALLIGALLVSQFGNRLRKDRPQWRSGRATTVILVGELILVLWTIKDGVIYELRRR
jgi:hypothetical protein